MVTLWQQVVGYVHCQQPYFLKVGAKLPKLLRLHSKQMGEIVIAERRVDDESVNDQDVLGLVESTGDTTDESLGEIHSESEVEECSASGST